MTAPECRVRIVGPRNRFWLTAPMTEPAAQAFLRDAGEALRRAADTPGLIAFPTTDDPIAFIRGRDVVSVELVTLPIPGRPAAAGGPSIGVS